MRVHHKIPSYNRIYARATPFSKKVLPLQNKGRESGGLGVRSRYLALVQRHSSSPALLLQTASAGTLQSPSAKPAEHTHTFECAVIMGTRDTACIHSTWGLPMHLFWALSRNALTAPASTFRRTGREQSSCNYRIANCNYMGLYTYTVATCVISLHIRAHLERA